ncbi:MAG TPA: hypothetical protein VF982_06855 [Anaerolineales bacterium]
MPRIRCHYADCVFLDEGYCSAAAVEIHPAEGCLTYSAAGEVSPEAAWEDNKELEEEWADAGFTAVEDDDDDLWLEEDLLEDEDEDEDFDLEEDNFEDDL